MPERGPRSVLCVVEVTTWQCLKGDESRPAAMSPEKWAMSAMRIACIHKRFTVSERITITQTYTPIHWFPCSIPYANRVRDGPHPSIVKVPRVGARAGDDQLGTEQLGGLLEGVVVHEPVGAELVRHRLKVDRGRRNLRKT